MVLGSATAAGISNGPQIPAEPTTRVPVPVTTPSSDDSVTSNIGRKSSQPDSSINKIALFNVEGLQTSATSSVPFIRNTLEEGKLLFAMLSETWLREQLDAELKIEGYTFF